MNNKKKIIEIARKTIMLICCLIIIFSFIVIVNVHMNRVFREALSTVDIQNVSSNLQEENIIMRANAYILGSATCLFVFKKF